MLPLKLAGHVLARPAAHLRAHRGIMEQDTDRARQLAGAVGPDQAAVLAIPHQLAHSGKVGRNHRHARGH